MGTIISEVVRLALHGLVNDCLHVSPASTRSLAVALHIQHHNDATARQLERQRLAQSIWFTPSIRESLTRATSYTVPKIIVGQPPTANRQPPTANRQPPTANRQPPPAVTDKQRWRVSDATRRGSLARSCGGVGVGLTKQRPVLRCGVSAANQAIEGTPVSASGGGGAGWWRAEVR